MAARGPWVVMPLVAVIALGGLVDLEEHTRAAPPSAPTGFGTQVVAVTSGPMDQSVTADGTVAVAQQQKASFASSGTVTAVNVAAGQTGQGR